MTKLLKRTVYVDGVAFRPGVEVPADIAARITNPKVWVDAVAAAPAPAGAPATEPRPRAADEPLDESWTVKELKLFAKAQDVVLGDARTKPAILAVLAEAGFAPATVGSPEGEPTDEDADAPEDENTEGADDAEVDADGDADAPADDA